jgi:DNA excision repair protein ERCC-4
VVQRVKQHEPITVPFTVLVDGREKAPYRFDGLLAPASQKKRPLMVTTEWTHLKTGDYSVQGLENVVVVERKSLADLYSTLGQHRKRFEAEHERLATFTRACVVIESDWDGVLNWPPERSKLNPKSVFGTAASWYVRYGIPWFAMEDRRLAEIFTFRFLEKAWREFHETKRSDNRNDERAAG